MTALLVDADADTRLMYSTFLAQQGVHVEEAEDGREALAKALVHPPDVVITETLLPGMSGIDLCKLLRRDDVTAGTPIIVITGDAFPERLDRARRAGADAVLVKPCLPNDLLAEIRRQAQRAQGLVEVAREVRTQAFSVVRHSREIVTNSREARRHRAASRQFERIKTTAPPAPPPALVCPSCDERLVYQRSHIGGVNARHVEQWDIYECHNGCGWFEYRHRTRKLRRTSATDSA